jgi:hypothetical protein
MNGATLTARYLDEVRRRGLRASELIGGLPATELRRAVGTETYLSRLLFLGAGEREHLYADVETARCRVQPARSPVRR